MEKKSKPKKQKPQHELEHIAISPELHKQLFVIKATGGYHNMTETIKSLIEGE